MCIAFSLYVSYLDYLVNTLKSVHPKALHGLSLEQDNIIKDSYAKIEKPLKAGEFYFIANEIACSFKDAQMEKVLEIIGDNWIS